MIATIGIGATVPSLIVNAHDNKPKESLVEKIATKFNLDQGQVEQVFDENRQEMKIRHEQEHIRQLASLVSDGKLTQDHADNITAKFADLKAEHEANHESMRDKTLEERKAAKEAKKAEMEQWAKVNGIDLSLIKAFGEGGHRP